MEGDMFETMVASGCGKNVPETKGHQFLGRVGVWAKFSSSHFIEPLKRIRSNPSQGSKRRTFSQQTDPERWSWEPGGALSVREDPVFMQLHMKCSKKRGREGRTKHRQERVLKHWEPCFPGAAASFGTWGAAIPSLCQIFIFHPCSNCHVARWLEEDEAGDKDDKKVIHCSGYWSLMAKGDGRNRKRRYKIYLRSNIWSS